MTHSSRFWLMFVGVLVNIFSVYGIYVSNLNTECFHCLCTAASFCSLDVGCDVGFCGPFKISRSYFIDAVKGTPLEGKGVTVYERCTNDLQCAQEIVANYMARYGKDCNDDGVTDCLDFGMISYNGGPECEQPLNRTKYSQLYGERLIDCTGHRSL